MVAKKRKIVFRCDGATLPEIGSGHVVRSIFLAKAFVSSGFALSQDILFITQAEKEYQLGHHLLNQTNFEVVRLGNGGLTANSKKEALSLIDYCDQADLLIVDRLATTTDFMCALKKGLSCKIVSMDDIGEGRFYTDLTINALLQNVEAFPHLLIGYEYLILPQKSYLPVELKETVQNVCVTFGAFDYRELTEFFIETINQFPSEIHYHIILGTLDEKKRAEIESTIKMLSCNRQQRITVYVRPKNFYSIIKNADLVVAAGGLTVFELLSFGLPVIALPQYEHQFETLNRLEKSGTLLLASQQMQLDDQIFIDMMSQLLTSFEKRKQLQKKALTLFDGKGVNRALQKIEQLLCY